MDTIPKRAPRLCSCWSTLTVSGKNCVSFVMQVSACVVYCCLYVASVCGLVIPVSMVKECSSVWPIVRRMSWSVMLWWLCSVRTWRKQVMMPGDESTSV